MVERHKRRNETRKLATGLILGAVIATESTIAGIWIDRNMLIAKPTTTDVAQPSNHSSLQAPGFSLKPIESPTASDFAIYSPEQTAKIKEIEAKYNINIFTVQEARAYAHQNLSSAKVQEMGIDNWQDTSIGLSDDQLALLEELIPYLPKNYYAPKDGKKFGIILRGEDFKYSGENYPVANMIGVSIATINPSDEVGSFSAIIHEGTHLLDTASEQAIWPKVSAILGDRAFIRLPEMRAYFENKDGLSSDYSNFDADQQAALATFSAFAPGQSFGEGIAGLAQLYVDGEYRFLSATGPLADDGGYTAANKYLSLAQLRVKFPKAEALYDLNKQTFFKDQEYNPVLGGGVMSNEMKDTFSVLEAAYQIRMWSNLSVYPNDNELTFLRQALAVMPKDFYAVHNGQLVIDLVETEADKPAAWDNNIVYVSMDSLIQTDAPGNISNAIGELTHDLAIRKDALTGYQTKDKIVDILGGDAFLNSPDSLYPPSGLYGCTSDTQSQQGGPNSVSMCSIFAKGADGKVDAEEMFGELAEFYMAGPNNFSTIGLILDPETVVSHRNWSSSKTEQLYKIMEKFFGGKQFPKDEASYIRLK